MGALEERSSKPVTLRPGKYIKDRCMENTFQTNIRPVRDAKLQAKNQNEKT